MVTPSFRTQSIWKLKLTGLMPAVILIQLSRFQNISELGLFRPRQDFSRVLFDSFSDEKRALIFDTQIRQLIFSFSFPQNMQIENMISIKAICMKGDSEFMI